MKVAILTIGTEILFGQIINTNATYLSKELNDMGFDVLYHHTVGDNPKRLKQQLDEIFNVCDMVITTGGLGPTQDDLTKETIAEYFGQKMILNNEILDDIQKKFDANGRIMTENNKRQACFPQNSTIFYNVFGTAPGCAIENGNKVAICLPGPPTELHPMFENEVKKYLEQFAEHTLYYQFIRTVGIGESQLETEIMDLIDGQIDPTIATYAKMGETYIRVTSKRNTFEESRKAVQATIKKITDRIGKYIYAYENTDLKDIVIEKLKTEHITISSAESCTGGLFADNIISTSGVSEIFDRSIVTYSNQSKIEELNVKYETLEKYGAVSKQTAIEMVEGLHQKTNSDICISVTGIAGPDGGTIEKPVGLVYIGIKYKGNIKVHEYRCLNNSRNAVRKRTVLEMFKIIYKMLGE